MISTFTFNSVAQINFGIGAVEQLCEVCQRLSIKRPLLVSDAGIEACGLLGPVQQQLEMAGIKPSVYAQVLPDPPEQNVIAAVDLGKSNNCDGVIGLGGGSPMDVAKLAAVLLASTQTLSAMYGVDMVTGKRLPLIQVPTTAGTGSEATAVAIITTGESTKAGVVSPVLFADHILLDPQLTLGLPPHVTAATGIDAMVHAIEAFTSKRLKNPLSDMVALQALTLLSANIEPAVKDGSDVTARSNMLLGAMLAGQAFANAPVGAVHALAYPLGGTYHIPHGLSNSLMLPHVLLFNAKVAAPLYSQIAKCLTGLAGFDTLDEQNIGQVLADHFLGLAQELGLQTRLRDMQIEESALTSLATQAMDQQRLLINNPREVNFENALGLYQQAF